MKERDANFKTYKMLFVKAKFAPLVLIKTALEGAHGVSLLKTCGIKFSNICHLSKIHQGFIFTKAIRFHSLFAGNTSLVSLSDYKVAFYILPQTFPLTGQLHLYDPLFFGK